MRARNFRNNRYWRKVAGSGHVCECCKTVGNLLATVEHRETGVRICMSRCYDHRRQALETALAARAWKEKFPAARVT